MRATLLMVVLAGCEAGPALGPDEIPLVIAKKCPGDPACGEAGDGKLYVGAAKRTITPTIETFSDANGDDQYDSGEAFVDGNGNGKFDPVWLAGRSNGLLAYGVHDDTWARAVVLRFNATTVAVFSVDTIGLFREPDLVEVRKLIDPALEIDLVISTATHNHHNQDVTGQWGAEALESGIVPEYSAFMRRQIADAIAEAARNTKPAKMRAGSILVAEGRDLTQYVDDTRDPVVIDPRMHVLEFSALDDNKPIVAIVNWASHPDSLGSKYHYVTSDFAHGMRVEAEDELGCDVVYVNGAVGGQIGPGHVVPRDGDGNPIPDRGEAFTEWWGRGVGRFVARALDASRGGDVVVDEAPKLSFVTTQFKVHVDNTLFQVAGQVGVISRPWCCFDNKKPLVDDNAPQVDTEMAYLTLGERVSILTMPGELLPELWLGGYDGSAAYNWRFLDTAAENAADPARAPKPPYLRDLMGGDLSHRMLFGLALDFFGYIVPRYNFVLDETVPYLRQPKGDHYEETNSLGPRAEPELVGTARQLIQYAEKK